MDRSPYPPRVQSYSTPALPRTDGANNNREASGNNTQHRSRSSSILAHNSGSGIVASHFLAQPPEVFGRQTWQDFLRETGRDNGNLPFSPLYNQRPERTSLENRRASSSQTSAPPPLNLGGSTLRPDTRPTPSRTSTETTTSDRKRRLTSTESPARRPDAYFTPPQPPQTTRPSAAPPNPADSPLASPPGIPQNYRRPSSNMIRRESDIILPAWQPDSGVTNCPVCGNQFTFWYRKHHCRKCGRVVCANCSPHRITIPRQFIVHPPEHSINIIDLTGDSDEINVMSTFGPYRNPALGGGEEVRVCNPCVPDPNFSPPPQRPQDTPTQASWPYPPENASFSDPRTPPIPPPISRPPNYDTLSLGRPLPRHRSSNSDVSQTRSASARVQPVDPVRNGGRHHFREGPDVFPTVTPQQLANAQQRGQRPRPSSQYAPQPSQQRHHHHHHHHSQSIPSAQSHYRSLLDMEPPLPPTPQQPQPQPQPRRQIAEEDECPICHNELPPKGPNNDETAREAHVQTCIEEFMGNPSSTSPAPTPSTAISAAIAASSATPSQAQGSQASASLPNPRTRGMSNAGASGMPSPGGGESSRPRRATQSNRMLVYQATEKDCVGEEGEAQECVICFEEFEEGCEMARLVCLCKFHRRCIRDWWERKGPGSCPTHQLHE